jgi:dTDP-4-dehydrorhamnose 3,5-epimerase
MIFSETRLAGAYLIDIERHVDERGFFARTWSQSEFADRHLVTDFVQHSISFNTAAGTLRGLHFQRLPHSETKIVRCLRGVLYDVIVDLRPQSPTCRQWAAFELTAESRSMLYIPAGFAHGFQTLTPDTEISYMISAPYAPDAGWGIRYDDPALGIEWPMAVTCISERDRSWPDLDATADGLSHSTAGEHVAR